MKKSAALFVSLCLLPSVSYGADTAFGTLESYGNLAVHRLSGDGFSDNYWSGDFGVRLNARETALPVSFGAYVGYEGLGFLDENDDIGFATAAIVAKIGPHELAIGMPRSIISDIFERHEAVANLLSDSGVNLINDTVRFVRLVGVYGGDEPLLYGFRYDGNYGQTSISGGLFGGEIDWSDVETSDIRVFQLALQHQARNLTFRAAFEATEGALYAGSVQSYSLGATVANKKTSYGADVIRFDAVGGGYTFIDLFGAYKFNEQWKASLAQSFVAEDGVETSLMFLGVEFAPTPSSFMVLTSTIQPSEPGNFNVYEASVGIRF